MITWIGELAGLGDDPHHRFGPHLPETGRAKPSREIILHLAEHLDVPLRARNELLLAAGFAPAYAEQGLENPQMAPLRDAVDLVPTG